MLNILFLEQKFTRSLRSMMDAAFHWKRCGLRNKTTTVHSPILFFNPLPLHILWWGSSVTSIIQAQPRRIPSKQPALEADGKALRVVLLEIIPDCHEFHLVNTNSYGKVYRAHHRALNRMVAVKLVGCINKGGVSSNTYTSNRGGRPKDFTIQQSITHPHVLEILSIYRGGTGETTNIITQFMLGGTLYDYLQCEYRKQRCDGRYSSSRSGLPEIACRDIMYQLCQAMAYVHRLGIVHRNLKLDNIFLTGDTIPFIKVAGFGLAARLPADGGFLTEVCGSIDHMPPEMRRDSSSELGYDSRADSWAAGVLMIEMLLLDNAYVTRRSFPEFEIPAFRWEELRTEVRLSADGTELLKALLSPDPILRYTLGAALQQRWLLFHQPMYPNVLYP
ncbi:hypothetical protein MVEN_00727200 [Mycena venus]|uniref:Protein kinase domain-containing protein n=1 Tax=Mycena venus TaxID=2733690 RepID=A0A8H6YJ76_9AGAR|nr:hypothetical protein MVEN_00727200 [Mycena venus]